MYKFERNQMMGSFRGGPMAFGRGGGDSEGVFICLAICYCCCLSIMLAGMIVYAVFLGIYGYGSPDPEECWWIKGLPESRSSQEAAIAYGNEMEPKVLGQPIDVHARFTGWFIWGFYTFLAQIMSGLVLSILGE